MSILSRNRYLDRISHNKIQGVDERKYGNERLEQCRSVLLIILGIMTVVVAVPAAPITILLFCLDFCFQTQSLLYNLG